jgi:hypothetical protein
LLYYYYHAKRESLKRNMLFDHILKTLKDKSPIGIKDRNKEEEEEMEEEARQREITGDSGGRLYIQY